MKRPLLRSFLLASMCLLAALGLACDAATPTAPAGTILTITANPSQISLDGVSQITVVGRRPDGNPLNRGTEIFFSTNLGSLEPAVATVDGDGIARATLRGDGRVGTASVQARLSTGTGEGAGTATIEVLVGRPAGAVSLQATPTSVPETGGTVQLLALVRDDQGQPLSGVSVNFKTGVGTLGSGGAFIRTNTQGEARDTLVLSEADLRSVTGDTFSVEATAAAGSAVQSDSATLSIFRKPVARFTFTRIQLTVIFQDQSTGNPTSWRWNFGDGNTDRRQNPSYTYSAPGTYQVTLVAGNAAGDSEEFRQAVTVETN